MDQQLEKIIIECAKNIKKRKELFFKIGQEFLKPLKDRELEEKTFEVFQLIIEHQKDWKGQILIPEYYRLDKKKSIFKDIWYTLRDYFAWCVLYNSEVDTYFKHDKNGTVEVLENPKVRIMDKDNFKQVTKIDNGKQVVVNVKKEKNFVIDSGFTLGQKDRILNVTVAGLIEIPPEQKKKSEKTSQQIDSKEKSTKSLAELDDTFDKLNQKADTNKKAPTKKVKKADTQDNSKTTSKDKKEEKQEEKSLEKLNDNESNQEEIKPKNKKVSTTKKSTKVESEEKSSDPVLEENETKNKSTKSKKK